MWRLRLVMLIAIVAIVFEGVQFASRHGADVYNYDFSGPCAWRPTDHWGLLESKADNPNAKTLKVLFIGDSLTFTNDLPDVFVRVASSDPSAPVRFEVRSATAPDATLAKLWDDGCGPMRLQTGHYDVAILQEHSFFWSPDLAESAREGAGRWILAARSYGARPIYFEPWVDPPDQGPALSDVEALKLATKRTAGLFGPDLARVGEAFAEATATPNAPDLYMADRHHPSEAGTWLAALVIFHGLSGEPAAQATWRPAGVTPDQAAILARIADQYGCASIPWR
jgi:hypothetical protein